MSKQNNKKSFLGACPICREELKFNNAVLISKKKAMSLFCVECEKCLSSVILTIFSSEKEGILTTMGILSDFKKEDISLLKNPGKIVEDDVLSFYEYLNTSKDKKTKKYETKSKNKRN